MNRNKISTYIVLATYIGIVLFFITSVVKKQDTLNSGELVYLELAPVDPRSLMQGDYMSLEYKIVQDARTEDFISDFPLGLDQPTTIVDSLFFEQHQSQGQEDISIQDHKMTYRDFPRQGYVEIKMTPQGIGEFVTLHTEYVEVAPQHLLLKYFNKGNWSFSIGAPSFFFEEGKAELFENAKYGALRVDSKGNSILVGMYDVDLNEIK